MHVRVYISTLLNCELLINPIIDRVVAASYMDNHGNSIANTCSAAQLIRRAVVISLEPKQAWPELC